MDLIFFKLSNCELHQKFNTSSLTHLTVYFQKFAKMMSNQFPQWEHCYPQLWLRDRSGKGQGQCTVTCLTVNCCTCDIKWAWPVQGSQLCDDSHM